MINAKLAIAILLTVNFASAGWIPPNKYSQKNESLIYRHFQRIDGWNVLMLETQAGTHLDDQNFQSFRVGGYHQLKPSFHLGAFLNSKTGQRHNEDWVLDGADWRWRNNERRREESLSLVTLNRFSTNSSIMFEWRNEVNGNFNNSNLSFKTRFGLIKSLEIGDTPKWQVFSYVELYFPLNFDYDQYYQSWLYLGGLYRLNENWKIGPIASFAQHRWVENDAIVATDSTWRYTNILEEVNFSLQVQSSF